MFGTYGKFGQIEISLHVDSKKPLLTHKTILVLILPSIVLHFSHNPHTLPTHTLQAQLWPLTNERETVSSTLSLTPVRAPSTVRQARQSTHLYASEFPSTVWVLFESNDLTSPPIHTPPPSCHSPSHRRSHTHLQHLQSVVGEAKLSNPPSISHSFFVLSPSISCICCE